MFFIKWLVLVCVGMLAFSFQVHAISPGQVDKLFAPAIAMWVTNKTTAIYIQKDGKILVAGNTSTDYEYSQSSPAIIGNYLVRYHSDGNLDYSFQPLNDFAEKIDLIEVQDDGKIILVGDFNQNGSIFAADIVRLNSDGTLDRGFNLDSSLSFFDITAIATVDNKVLLAGRSNSSSEPQLPYYIFRRLNSDGSFDTAFSFADNVPINTVVITDGKKVLIGGNFTFIENEFRSSLAMLNSNGELDSNFIPQYSFGLVSKIKIQNDGKIWVLSGQGLIRLNADGSHDSGFSVGNLSYYNFANQHAYGYIYNFDYQLDGKIVVAGYFNRVDGVIRQGIARLNIDGTLDSTFDASIDAFATDYSNTKVMIGSDGYALVGGNFSKVNSLTQYGLSKISLISELSPVFPESEYYYSGSLCSYKDNDSGIRQLVCDEKRFGMRVYLNLNDAVVYAARKDLRAYALPNSKIFVIADSGEIYESSWVGVETFNWSEGSRSALGFQIGDEFFFMFYKKYDSNSIRDGVFELSDLDTSEILRSLFDGEKKLAFKFDSDDQDPDVTNFDYDFDGYFNDADNCPSVFNNDQLDSDRDGMGDACDSFDNDKNKNYIDDAFEIVNIQNEISRGKDRLDLLAKDKNSIVQQYSSILEEASRYLAGADEISESIRSVNDDFYKKSSFFAQRKSEGASKWELKSIDNEKKILKKKIKALQKTQKNYLKAEKRLLSQAAKLVKKHKLSSDVTSLAAQIRQQEDLLATKKAELGM